MRTNFRKNTYYRINFVFKKRSRKCLSLPVLGFPCKIAQALKGWQTFLLRTSRKSRRYSKNQSYISMYKVLVFQLNLRPGMLLFLFGRAVDVWTSGRSKTRLVLNLNFAYKLRECV